MSDYSCTMWERHTPGVPFTHIHTHTLPQAIDIFSHAIRSAWLATIMRRGRWRLIPFIGQQTDKTQRPGLELGNCLLAVACVGCLCLSGSDLYSPRRCCGRFCLIWACCSLPAITWHCRVDSQRVFLSTPRGGHVIAQCWWEQPWLREPSHTTIMPMEVQLKKQKQKNSEYKETNSATWWEKVYGLTSSCWAEPRLKDDKVKLLKTLGDKEFLSC